MKNKRGRNPLPIGWKRVCFNASPELQAYYRTVQRAHKLATRGDVLRLITNEAHQAGRFLTGIDANLAQEQE